MKLPIGRRAMLPSGMDIPLGSHTFDLEFHSRPSDSYYPWRAECQGLGSILRAAGHPVVSTAAGNNGLELRLKASGTGLKDGVRVKVTTEVLLRPHREAKHPFNHLIVLSDVISALALQHAIEVHGAEPRAIKGDRKAPPAIRVVL